MSRRITLAYACGTRATVESPFYERMAAEADIWHQIHDRHGSPAWWSGWNRAGELLAEIDGALAVPVCRCLLTVEPDPEDDADYDAGFRAHLRAAALP